MQAGIRAALPISVGTFLLAFSFGLAAQPVLGADVAIAMSALLFAGAAQFGALAVVATGGDVLTAVAAGALINLRYMPMSLAMAPSMPTGLIRRCLIAMTMTDPGWAMAARSEGRFDAHFMLGTAIPQYVLWQLGTVIGVLLGSALSEPETFGIDALFPAFFLAILLGGELRSDRTGIAVAAIGGIIALLLVPVAPAGIPLVAASIAALVVLLRPRSANPADPDTHTPAPERPGPTR